MKYDIIFMILMANSSIVLIKIVSKFESNNIKFSQISRKKDIGSRFFLDFIVCI